MLSSGYHKLEKNDNKDNNMTTPITKFVVKAISICYPPLPGYSANDVFKVHFRKFSRSLLWFSLFFKFIERLLLLVSFSRICDFCTNFQIFMKNCFKNLLKKYINDFDFSCQGIHPLVCFSCLSTIHCCLKKFTSGSSKIA